MWYREREGKGFLLGGYGDSAIPGGQPSPWQVSGKGNLSACDSSLLPDFPLQLLRKAGSPYCPYFGWPSAFFPAFHSW